MPCLRLILPLLLLMVLAPMARAEVLRVDVETREPVLGGKTFGEYGPYEVIRGRITFGFDPASKDFFLEFESNPEIDAPTEIYLPARRHYPGGWEIISSDPDGRWRYEWDDEREVLLLWTDAGSNRHRVEIRALP